jgi:hypothetical protein
MAILRQWKSYQEIMELHTCRAKRNVKPKGIERREMLTRGQGIASRKVDQDNGGSIKDNLTG